MKQGPFFLRTMHMAETSAKYLYESACQESAEKLSVGSSSVSLNA